MENSTIKVIANYLPQFHEIPENNKFWGQGYTDWVAVKNAKSLFINHDQPKIPYNSYYYSLDDYEDIKNQVGLANRYRVDGFNIYHYWFNNDLNLLSKPVEIILEHSELNIKYMFTWDNASWKRTWSAVKHANDWAPMSDSSINKNEQSGVLAELVYGAEEDWRIHFNYLLKFFKDERYLKEDNMPLFGLFNPDNQPKVLKKMIEFWNNLACQNGFNGLKVICKCNHGENKISPYSFKYEPGNSAWETRTFYDKVKLHLYKNNVNSNVRTYDYEAIWNRLIRNAKRNTDENIYFGSFVNFDDSPRRGNNGRVIVNGSPILFEKYFDQLLQICKQKHKTILFLTAWNEWGEGAYLEPDKTNGFEYLEALNRCVNRNK